MSSAFPSIACISLKKGKERPLLQKHHWIYSGAIQKVSSDVAGDLAKVYSAAGDQLGLAFLNPGHSIAGHMIAFGTESLEEALFSRLSSAIALRKKWFHPEMTDAYRLINAEGDGIPGLIIDVYADVFVLQISHPGIEKCKDLIVNFLIQNLHPKAIYEKSTSFLRKKEGLKEVREHLYGEEVRSIVVKENGLSFLVNILEGQKTGFFLDQREMRLWVKTLAKDRRVLNCFSYTGGFSISALSGGALQVDSVEISEKCKAITEENLRLNSLSQEKHQFIQADVFDFFKTSTWNYDLVVLDPPAFVKKREDVAKAFRAYKDMNRYAMEKMEKNSLLLTCSCSYHIEESLFQNILFRAASEAKRQIRILGRHRAAIDHPVSIFHPESAYLKSFLLSIGPPA